MPLSKVKPRAFFTSDRTGMASSLALSAPCSQGWFPSGITFRWILSFSYFVQILNTQFFSGTISVLGLEVSRGRLYQKSVPIQWKVGKNLVSLDFVNAFSKRRKCRFLFLLRGFYNIDKYYNFISSNSSCLQIDLIRHTFYSLSSPFSCSFPIFLPSLFLYRDSLCFFKGFSTIGGWRGIYVFSS